jgi:hypothetical protein
VIDEKNKRPMYYFETEKKEKEYKQELTNFKSELTI